MRRALAARAGLTEAGTALDHLARQAIDALLALKDAADAARAAGRDTIDQETPDRQARWYADAAAAGIALNAGRKGCLQDKRHALATRMSSRAGDCLHYARDVHVPFDDNEAERVIRMSKLRIKVSGSMRSLVEAGAFCAIRS